MGLAQSVPSRLLLLIGDSPRGNSYSAAGSLRGINGSQTSQCGGLHSGISKWRIRLLDLSLLVIEMERESIIIMVTREFDHRRGGRAC